MLVSSLVDRQVQDLLAESQSVVLKVEGLVWDPGFEKPGPGALPEAAKEQEQGT